jgi:(2R)-sulfolactate sulfo-lyase subunit alpha
MTTADPPDFLVHAEGDSVAVAVRDLAPGTVTGGYLAGTGAPGSLITAQLAGPVALGHKFALRDIAPGEDVIEYGVRVAVATSAIAAGEHAHVHNLRSARWHSSAVS